MKKMNDMDILEKLKGIEILYKNEQYYFISDICSITGIQRTYIYKLIKDKILKSIKVDGVRLIYVDSFNDYYNKKVVVKKDSKSEILKKLKGLDVEKLREIEKLIEK